MYHCIYKYISVYFDEEDPTKPLAASDNCRVMLSTEAQALDTVNKTIILSTGEQVTYDSCCIATGAVPRTVNVLTDVNVTSGMDMVVHIEGTASNVLTYRSLDDMTKLYTAARGAKSIAVIGGGYLGTELAYALAKTPLLQGITVQLYTAHNILGRVLPPYLSNKIRDYLAAAGVTVKTENKVEVCTTAHHVSVGLTTGQG